jgi:UDP-glucose 4-epimerase
LNYRGTLKDKKRTKRILLIGGSGFIGMHIVRALSIKKCEITLIVKQKKKKLEYLDFCKNVKSIIGDIKDYDFVEKIVSNQDVIINLASVINNGSKFDPFQDIDTNLIGQINILEARKKVNFNSIYICFGSRSQFGIVSKSELPITENQCQRPFSLYAIHKQTAENYCNLYDRSFGLKSIVLRLSIVFGYHISGEETPNFINNIVKKCFKNEMIYVNGYGKDVKDLIYVGDVADLITTIIESEINQGTFNIGSGTKISLLEVTKKIIKLCGAGRYTTVPFPKEIEKFELGDFYFDISKVKKTFKWKPKTSINVGLKKTIQFLKK